MEQLIGYTLNRYKIISLLGEGGMGAVFKAHDLTLQRDVAIKVMHAHFARQPDFQERFLQEARTAAKLDHSNIVQVFDFGQDRSYLYIVMKFIPGDNLEKMLRDLRAEGKWILLTEAVGLIQQTASALDYAHRQGVLHRDIKPGNIMIEPEPSNGLPYRPIVTDLGLAKLAEGGVLTQDGASMGTPAYMSPEQALGKETDARSDVYSLGVLLFELATGRLPYPARNLAEAIQYHVHTPPPPPRSIRADILPELEQIILTCMEKEPKKRYPTAAALAGALQKVSHSTHAVQSAPSPLQGAISLFTQYQQSLVIQRGVSVLEEFEIPAERFHDRIQVLGRDKTTRSVRVKRPTMMIGRDPDNDIVLDDHKTSRHHTRVEYTGEHYQVVDLNSTNGTYLANKRLLPGVPEVWLPEKALRVGETWFRLLIVGSEATGATVRNEEEEQGFKPNTGESRLSISLDTLQVKLEPGQSYTLQMTIQNLGASEEIINLAITGLPADWFRLPVHSVLLGPGEQKSIPFPINPPNSPQSRAGLYPVSILANSQRNPTKGVETGFTLTISTFSKFSSTLTPSHLQPAETGWISIQNMGNAPEDYSIDFADPSGQLVFTPPQSHLNIPNGAIGKAKFQVEVRHSSIFGGRKSYPFTAQVKPTLGRPQKHQAELTTRAGVPFWLISTLIIACLGLIVAGSFIINQLISAPGENGVEIQTQTAAAVQTKLALVVQQTNDSSTATALALQNANQSTVDAATATSAWLEQDDDKDGLSNREELALNTLPAKRDTDEDGLDDGEEVNQRKTDPLKPDSDSDGIKDGEEVSRGMNPLNPDSDGDGIPDPQDPAPILTSTATVDLQATLQAANQATQQAAATQTALAYQATAQMAAQLTAAAAQTASAAQAATLTAQAIRRLAYIYSADPGAANEFKTYLESQGYLVDLIQQSNIFATDFGPYKAILIGRDTGSTSTWADGAGSTAAQIQATGKPILGLGEGGYAFFGKLGLTIGWGNGAHGDQKDIHVINPGQGYWNDPYNLSIPASQEISLYDSNSGYVGIYYPSPVAGVETVANIPSSTDYYPLIREAERYFLWGFEGAPSAMTGKGQRVLVNVLEALIP